MSGLKKLAGETAIYGAPSIIGRVLNWFLVPFYSRMFHTGEYGVVSNIYAYVAFLLVILTYGMETSYFRFASRHKNADQVYFTALASLFFTSTAFVIAVFAFAENVSVWMELGGHSEYLKWMGLTVALDAFTSIPFARLRLKGKAIKFAFLRFLQIAINIGLNLFLIYFCPKIIESNPHSVLRHLYDPQMGIGYIFLSNLLSTAIIFILLIPEYLTKNVHFSFSVLKQMLSYGWPLLIVGLAGMVNQNIEKILLPELLRVDDPISELGIYAANFKLAVLMNLFIQAFRYAFEPFFFSHHKGEDSKQTYADVMKYFVILGLTIFLGVMLYIDIIVNFIDMRYHDGVVIVPWVLMANLLLGIYYALSLWYKLTDQTQFGARFAIMGAVVTLSLNVLLVPRMGYMGSAIAFFSASVLMVVVSYLFGQKYFPVNYNLPRLAGYFGVALILFVIGRHLNHVIYSIQFALRTVLMVLFLLFVFYKEQRELKKLLRR